MTKSTATQRKVSRRNSAECTGLRIEITRIDAATATVPMMKKTRRATFMGGLPPSRSCVPRPASCVQMPRTDDAGRRTQDAGPSLRPSRDLFRAAGDFRCGVPFRQSRVTRPVVPVLELLHVEVEIVAVVRGQLVSLGGQPDRLRLGRAGLFAERAEHAALDVDVVAIEDFELLHLSIDLALLVVDVDVDDVDGTGQRAELAGDAAIEGELEHAAKAIRRLEALLRIADGHLRFEQLAERRLQPLEHVEEEKAVGPLRLRILNQHAQPPSASAETGGTG